MDIRDLTIETFHKGLLAKEFSALEITQEFFDYIADTDPDIDAYLRLTKDLAFSTASEVDAEVKEESISSILAGVPLAVKDNILIEGEPATAASKILEKYRAAYDATVIQKLKAKHAIFLGKTNLDEFAMGSSTENSGFKVTKNPSDLSRVPGGSSGGSAAAVASGMALAALGSDTGGSIRQPAGFCGVVGLKPTYGAVSRYGLIAMASSLDQIGPITKTVKDASTLFNAIQGKDDYDATSVDASYGDDLIHPDWNRVKKLKIGLPKEYFEGGLEKEVEKALDAVIAFYKTNKFDIKEISLPHTKHSLSVYYIIMPAEVSANLARYDNLRFGASLNEEKGESLWEVYREARSAGFGVETKRRVLLGTFVLSSGYYDAYYAQAQKVRRLIKEDFEKVFDSGVDVILTPVSPTTAFKIGEKAQDPLSMYLSDIFTIPVNLAGLPAVSIPAQNYADFTRTHADLQRKSAFSPRQSAALPVGFQLIGKPFRETDILGLGRYYEENRN